jgi:Tfp pilus assembly protein PilO
MRKSRRQIANRIVELAALGLVAMNLAVFFGVYRPLGEKLAGETRRHAELRQMIRNEQSRVELLDKFKNALPLTGKELEDFTSNRIPPRREAYSTADHLVHKVADASGVKVSTLGFRLEREQKDPLEQLALSINVQGPYEGLLKFSHALETANDFILLRGFTITPGDAGALGLRLDADLYLTP